MIRHGGASGSPSRGRLGAMPMTSPVEGNDHVLLLLAWLQEAVA